MVLRNNIRGINNSSIFLESLPHMELTCIHFHNLVYNLYSCIAFYIPRISIKTLDTYQGSNSGVFSWFVQLNWRAKSNYLNTFTILYWNIFTFFLLYGLTTFLFGAIDIKFEVASSFWNLFTSNKTFFGKKEIIQIRNYNE